MYVCMYVCMYVRTYVCMYVYMHIYVIDVFNIIDLKAKMTKDV